MKSLLKKIIPKSILNLRHLFYAWWGARQYGHPSEELLVIGVTGTSGKSTSCYFLRQVLEAAGMKVGVLSTIEFCIAGECQLNDKKMTMLGKMEIQKYLRRMVDKKCDVAIVETTSEGRLQHRHRWINYDMMMLTNLYPEHIESHGSFENYKQAKLDIFSYVANCKKKQLDNNAVNKTAIVNDQSEYKNEFLQYAFDIKKTFSASDMSVDENGLRFKVEDHVFHPNLFAQYNATNLAAVITIARELGLEWSIIQKAVNNISDAPGRIEFIQEAERFGFKVIVDYAFEPVAMEALYKVVALLSPKRVIHVFGSTGGGRDVERRFSVGQLIGQKADICIVTDEDPYDDDPQEIIDDVARAVEQTGKKEGHNLYKVLNRRDAVQKAISLAAEGDMVLVTGKGSEQAMVVKGELIPWDDRVAVRQALKNQ